MRLLAVCVRDRTPLIGTMMFRKAEYFCLTCGAKYGMFGFGVSTVKKPAQELIDLYEKLQGEWKENVDGKIIIPNSWVGGCELCWIDPEHSMGSREIHSQHATDDQWKADREARTWINGRVGSVVA